MTWIEKYRPKNFNNVKGQDEAISKIKMFVNSFPKKRALVLHGSPGVGKTTLAHVVANEMDSEIFELNASDLRNRAKLKEILKPAIEQKSLLKKGKIILVDEVDGISKFDYGGLTELLYLISSTSYPMIITANDIWDKRFSSLRKKAEVVQLKEIDYKIIKDILVDILRREALFVNMNILASIAIRAKGDIRAAVNDLQTASRMQDPSLITFDERNKEKDIFNALRMIFKGKPTKDLLNVFDSVNMPMDEILLWVEENVSKEYNGEELVKAVNALSRADLFKGRIYRKQYWRFLVYENIFLSYAISAAKKNVKPGFTSYKRSTRILKIWLNNQRIAKKKSIAKKYAQYVHVGEKRALSEFPVIKYILKNPETRKELKLTEEEIGYLER